MNAQNKKKLKKLDLLEMSHSERTKLIKEVKGKLKQTIKEAKLWHSLLQVDNLSINGDVIYSENEQLKGFLFEGRI